MRACGGVTVSPAMMPDRIGIIGSTQGVKVSRMPAPKNAAAISHRLPEASSLSKRASSPITPGESAAGAASANGVDTAPGPDAPDAGASPASLISAVCTCGM